MAKARTLRINSSFSSRDDLFSLPGVMKASDLVARTGGSPPPSPERWKELITAAFHSHLSIDDIESEPYSIEYEVKKLYRSLLKTAPAEPEWTGLYRLFAAFYIFSALSEQLDSADLSPETSEKAAYDILFYLADETFDAAKMTGSTVTFAKEPYIDLLRKDTGRLLSFPFQLFPAARLDMYRLLWESLFTKKEWRLEEQVRTMPNAGSSTVQLAAQMHQLYLLGEMEAFVEQAASAPADLFLYLLHWLQDAKRTEKFIPVLRAAAVLAPAGIFTIENEYSRRLFIRQVVRIVEDSHVLETAPMLAKDLYTSLLPFSYAPFSYFLIDGGFYAEWADLQIFMNADLNDLEMAGLKTIIKEAPELSLPLLHQGISKLIAEKNRQSYRKAVRFAKRLRTIYKKIQRTDEFEEWLDWLFEETKRLRAFQEECRKGGLLND